MKYILVLLFILVGSSVWAQSAKELERQLANTSDRRQKMMLHYELGKAYLRSDTKKSIDNSKSAHERAVQLNNKEVAAQAAYLVSRAYNRENDYRREVNWLESTIALAKQANDADLIIKAVDKVSRLIIRKNRSNGHRMAYTYVQDAFDYFSKGGDRNITDFQAKFERDKAKLERDRKKLERERQKLRDEIESLASERDNLKDDNTVLTERQRILEREKEDVEKEIEEKDEAIQEVEKKRRQIERDNRKQREKIDDLELAKQLADAEIANQDMRLQLAKKEQEQGQYLNFLLAGLAVLFILLALTNYFRFRAKKRTNAKLEVQNKIIEEERRRSDELLLNILPAPIAQELKETGKATAQKFKDATVLFTDFKNFTRIASMLTPEKLVKEIDDTFRAFDFIISQYDDLEKIKTIGDAYMVASGLTNRKTIPYNMIKAAKEMQEYLEETKEKKIKLNEPFFEARIGIHTGPVVAGVVGNKKFAYDIWGDTVNIAARMEANCEVGKVNLSEVTAGLVKYKHPVVYRGKVQVKNKGMMDMYYLQS